MFSEFLAGIMMQSFTSFFTPSDGALLEAAAQEEVYDPGVRYGARGDFFNAYLQRLSERAPIKVDERSKGVVTAATSSIVVDDETGVLLYGERPYDVRPIASVTKLMAAMVFLDTNPDLSQMVTLDPATDLVRGGRQYIDFYRPVRLRDVLAVVLIGSDNSGTQSLVRFAGLSEEEFVDRMNQKARELSMSKTFFTDPTGIEATNVSTAFDLSRLLRAARAYSEIREFTPMASYSFEQAGTIRTVENTNSAVSTYSGDSAYRVVLGKTGYLPEAGFVLASSIDHEGTIIHSIVLGSSGRQQRSIDMRALAEWAFRVYEWPSL